MGITKDLRGRQYGRLSVLSDDPRKIGTRLHWKVRCQCGTVKWVSGNALQRSHTVSCGCYLSEIVGTHSRKHGLSHSPLYRAWSSMKTRCTNPNRHTWVNYGGRGITVCERWMSFSNFLKDMGPSYTEGMTLERKNNDEGYSPVNCVWIPALDQVYNTRRTVLLVDVNGEKLPLSKVARKYNIHVETLRSRVRSRNTTNVEALL